MGVTGLWKLIEPCGKPVPVETLEGKVLAIDISIWLHQVVKGFQDNKGAALNNAHLLGLFHRLCKLMYYRVKPVFVFDGCVPQLKRETIARRQQHRSKLNSEADRIQALLLQSLAKEKVVQQALGSNAEFLLTSPVKKLAAIKANRREDTVDDMFKLPDLPSTSKSNINENDDETTDDSVNENSFSLDDQTTSGTADDSSFEESNPRNAYNSNLQAIDVKSKEFLQLPADVRHEILVDIKETRKQSSWGRLQELPSRSDDFSNFQMKRLLKRRDVQVSLERAEQEMGGRTLTYAELTNIFSEEGILETDIVEKGTKQISSDEHTRFLLVKDLKKKLSQVKEDPIQKEFNDDIKKDRSEPSPSTSKTVDIHLSSSNEQNDKQLGDEYEADLELAIALSLEEDNKVYDEKDYEFDTSESLKLTKGQRQQLQNAAKGPARSYMIEYAGMNKEEVLSILEKTQTHEDFDSTLNIERLIGDTDENIRKPETNETKQQLNNSESQDICLYVTDDSDSTDSDLEKEIDFRNNRNSAMFIEVEAIENISTSKKLNNSKLEDKILDSDTDSDLEEVKDSNSNEPESYETKKTEVLQNKETNKHNEIEDECVIEETPPLLQDEEVAKTKNCKILNIQIDLSEPLKPDDDIFADIFYDKEKKEEIVRESPASIRESIEIIESKPLMLNKNETQVQIKAPLKTENMLSILDQLKQEANEIKNIKLENIKLSESVIEISDDESVIKANEVKNEIIEICDSYDNRQRPTTPPPQLSANQSPINKSKSPKLTTPSKNHSITEFFEVNYVVKRTPDKPRTSEKNQAVSKVKSPFFVRKTPKSGRKSGSKSPSPNKKPKVNKSLFEQEPEDYVSNIKDNSNDDATPFIESKKLNEEDVLKEAASLLKAQTTREELNTIASDLAKERQELENERNRQDRMGMSITQRMNSDCQKLLRLFGVPFIVAPMEAEAQCAFLDMVQLTHGTITDDSDIWLFGGRTVYKNFFAQNKHVMEYRAEQIKKDFNCDRRKLIQLACLVGSDYTTGIHGIGAVTALEILASFTPKENVDKMENSIQSILATLQRFRNWWLSFKSAAAPPGSSVRLSLQKKLKNIELHEGFPNIAVIEAYLSPKVDDNKEAFTWGYPDVESLKEFAKTTFGWTSSKTDEILKPVLKKLNEKRTQQSIRNYFNVKNALSLRQIKVSKRVQNAVDRMTGNVDPDETPEKPIKAKKPRKTTSNSGVKGQNKNKTISKTISSEGIPVNAISLTTEPASGNQISKVSLKRAAKCTNIPETKQIIPQREKDLAQMEANKKLAAEILKNTFKDSKKKRKA